jgi:serine/threonine-protein kinase
VVHRDLKPQNIVLGEFGEVYILDWGVAKMLADPDTDEGTSSSEEFTADGTIVGTRAYMAPEQALAQRDVDGRADVYALGCVLFEILAGEPLHSREHDDPRPSRRSPSRDIPPELDELCVAATRREREARLQTARELGERVQRFLDGDRDLALRCELARNHLDTAQAAFASDDRRTAMREAGRALALDPELAGAGELVSRLMLEPPRVPPAGMQRMIDADETETLRRMARAGAIGYIGFLCFTPLVFAGGRLVGYILAFVAILAINSYLLLAKWLFAYRTTRAILVIAGNASIVFFLSRLCSPFLITPSVAALAAMALISSPTYQKARAVIVLAVSLLAAVMLPWAAEAAGVLAPTMQLDHDLVLHPPLLDVSPFARVMVLALHLVAIVGAGAYMAFENRRAERSIRNRLHLQAWHLHQLVEPNR